MAVHKLFLGGMPQKYTYERNMFPSVDFPEDVYAGVDRRKFESHFSNSRKIDFSCGPGCAPCGGLAYPEAEQLKQYFENTTFAVGDIIELTGISRLTVVNGVWIMNTGTVPGLTLQPKIKGVAGSSVPTDVDVGPVLDCSTVVDTYIHFDAPLYFTKNSMLQFEILTLPTPPAEPSCSSCIASPFSGWHMWSAVVGFEVYRGDRMSEI